MTMTKTVRTLTMMVVALIMLTNIATPAFAAEIEMPLYNQLDYNDAYMRGTIRQRGCGITSLSMVATYLLQDESLTPVYLATVYGDPDNKVDGVDYGTLRDVMVTTGELLGLNMELVWHWSDARTALEEGKVVISLQNPGVFTAGGHFIVLRGLTQDGYVLVNDPNGANYRRYPYEFEHGFHPSDVADTASGYWIVTLA